MPGDAEFDATSTSAPSNAIATFPGSPAVICVKIVERAGASLT
ncbi:MAG: hypothetical protein ACRDJM_04960 [Actinomycetota bacterium]